MKLTKTQRAILERMARGEWVEHRPQRESKYPNQKEFRWAFDSTNVYPTSFLSLIQRGYFDKTQGRDGDDFMINSAGRAAIAAIGGGK